MGRRCAAALVVAGLLTLAGNAHAQPSDEAPAVYVLTFGPGDHPFFKFGHNAIWIQPRDQPGLVYNFGTFQFDSPVLIPKFLRGRLKYWLSVSPAVETLYSYQASNRTIEAQELDLTPAEARALWENLRRNERPENREYLYDYFWDNCSTRVRDAVDVVLGGAVRNAARVEGDLSFRGHALRMTSDMLPVYLGLHLGLGSLTDAPLTAWEESFLPERLRDLLRATRVTRDGRPVPLVKGERVLYQARRPPVPDRPPVWTPAFAVVGLGLGGGLALLGATARRRRSARIALGATTSFLGFVLGLLGLILVLLWLLTNHKAAHANANILQFAPWALALVVYGVGVARGRPVAVRRALWLVAAAALLSVVGLAAKLAPGSTQDNHAFIALLLPFWVGLGVALRLVDQRRPVTRA